MIDNCPTTVISYDEKDKTLVVDDPHCIRCRQCEVASDGAFKVEQPWQGKVELRREKCVEGCLACADICPTRALHIDEERRTGAGRLLLHQMRRVYADLPGQSRNSKRFRSSRRKHMVLVKPLSIQRITNADDLPVYVERWRVNHTPVVSGAWTSALERLADDKAGMVEIDRKRALKRRDLIMALKGGHAIAGK